MTTTRPSSVDMLARLVAFDTTSRNSNLELIHFVAGYLADHGIASELVHDETGAKANLWATIGPDTDGGVVLDLPGIPTWCRSTASPGPPTPGR